MKNDAVFQRRSIRKYPDGAVEPESVERARFSLNPRFVVL